MVPRRTSRLDDRQRDDLSPVGALVRRHDRDRFQTALFAPAPRREALFALYAFNYEIARVRESVHEAMLGRIRLQWWREAIEAAYSDKPPRRHEVVEPLTAAICAHRLSREHFDRLIEARERDLDEAPPATLDELEAYAEGSSAPLIQLALEVLDVTTPAAKAAANAVGVGYALTGLIRALPHHARTGRLWIPDDVAAETGFDPRDYTALRSSPALCLAVERIAAVAQRHLAAARAMRRDVPRQALAALLPARVAAQVLRRLERIRFDPFEAAGAADPLQSWRLALAALLGGY